MKKYIALILSCMLLVAQCSLVSASETEQYEMVEMNNDDIFTTSSQGEVAPCLMYIANIYTSIIKISSNQIGIRAEIHNGNIHITEMEWKSMGACSIKNSIGI